jgi:hypothetical protein
MNVEKVVKPPQNPTVRKQLHACIKHSAAVGKAVDDADEKGSQ